MGQWDFPFSAKSAEQYQRVVLQNMANILVPCKVYKKQDILRVLDLLDLAKKCFCDYPNNTEIVVCHIGKIRVEIAKKSEYYKL